MRNKTKTEVEKPNVNIIGQGTEIFGDVKSGGDLRIDGVVKGSIEIKGKLVIGISGYVEGNIFCQNADISGRLKGSSKVEMLLSLHTGAEIEGDITTNKLSIEQGANFQGVCRMHAEAGE